MAAQVKTWRILLDQSITAQIAWLTITGKFGLERRCKSSEWC